MRNARAFPLALVAIAAAACGGHEAEAPPAAAAEPVSVRVEKLKPANQAELLEAVGTVRAHEVNAVSSKIPSYIRRMHVDVGDRVRPGQLLVELDDRELVSNLEGVQAAKAEAQDAIQEASYGLATAQAQLELAQVTHRRYEDLLNKASVSRQEYDQVSAQLRSAQAAVEMAQARRRQAESKLSQVEAQITGAEVTAGYARIEAPFAGIVTERRLDPGSLATPGMPILMIDQAGRYRLEAAIPESRLALLKIGQSVAVSIASLSETLDGKVAEIVPAVDAASRTFIARIALPPHASLRSGMFGRARIPAGDQVSLQVPSEAVITKGQLQYVMVVEGEVARRRLVTLGDLSDGRYEVLSGLRGGDQVVLEPGDLADGGPVRVRDTVSGHASGRLQSRAPSLPPRARPAAHPSRATSFVADRFIPAAQIRLAGREQAS